MRERQSPAALCELQKVLVKAAGYVKEMVWVETAVPFREALGVVVCFMPTCKTIHYELCSSRHKRLAVSKQDHCSDTDSLISV